MSAVSQDKRLNPTEWFSPPCRTRSCSERHAQINSRSDGQILKFHHSLHIRIASYVPSSKAQIHTEEDLENQVLGVSGPQIKVLSLSETYMTEYSFSPGPSLLANIELEFNRAQVAATILSQFLNPPLHLLVSSYLCVSTNFEEALITYVTTTLYSSAHGLREEFVFTTDPVLPHLSRAILPNGNFLLTDPSGPDVGLMTPVGLLSLTGKITVATSTKQPELSPRREVLQNKAIQNLLLQIQQLPTPSSSKKPPALTKASAF